MLGGPINQHKTSRMLLGEVFKVDHASISVKVGYVTDSKSPP